MNRDEMVRRFDEIVAEMMRRQGFPKTLRSISRGTTAEMVNILEGVGEISPSGRIEGSIQTDKGHIVFAGVTRNRSDPQVVQSPGEADAAPGVTEYSAVQLLNEVAAAEPPRGLLCAVELTQFSASQKQVLLPLLWTYILRNRNSNKPDDLVAVSAAIRKYIAILPMSRISEVAVLLDSGNRAQLSIELEIEVAKMIYRNFEVHPPVRADQYPELASRLFEMAHAYTNPRVLLRDKYSAAASLSIEALASLRSTLTAQALKLGSTSPHRWFSELISDDLDDLYEHWIAKNSDAAAWLREVRGLDMAPVMTQ